MSKFNNISTAENYRSRSINPSKWAIILGCDGLYWLVTNKEASRLMKQGYELAVF